MRLLSGLVRISAARLRGGARLATASFIAALLSFWTVAYFARQQALIVQLCISAVIIALSTVRSDERKKDAVTPVPHWVTWLARFVVIPLVALLGTLLGPLLRHAPQLGFALIGVPLVLAIWVRRFGPVWARLGSLWSFPFVAALVTPGAAIAHGAGPGWGALAALIAVGWGSLLGWLALGPHAGRAPQRGRDARVEVPRPRAGSRLAASDRMAIHLAVSLAAAIVLGGVLLPQHLAWFVLTAFLVNSGNRGRADVVYKGVQRVVGAALGTIVATLIGTLFAPGDASALVVLFAMLGVGAVLRTMSYAWWAAAMTGGLALLYAYLGQGGTGLLGERLLAIAVGGAIAVAVSFFLLPVRSIDVVRRRTADLVTAGRDALAASDDGTERAALAARASAAAGAVAQLAPPFHALRLVTLGRVAVARGTAELIDRGAAVGPRFEAFAAASSPELEAELRGELRALRGLLLALRRE